MRKAGVLIQSCFDLVKGQLRHFPGWKFGYLTYIGRFKEGL
jgi:hypothetical protein